MKKILIIGKGSYIGESLYKWMTKYGNKYEICVVSSLNYEWKLSNFYEYDVVVDFAGIAHISNITNDMEKLFYSVNRDLTIEIAEYSKKLGIKHFIYFSSMNVYGDFCDGVNDINDVNPTSFYGKSKLCGDEGVRKLADENFVVTVIRPPFVYGSGCKGNYNLLSNISKKLPVFPTYRNKKSMIYIDNLCEFIRLIIDNRQKGIFIPQNKELVSTSDIVKEISSVNGKKVFLVEVFNPLIKPLINISGLFKKAFSNDYFDIQASNYFDWEYCVVDFKTSIRKTEEI